MLSNHREPPVTNFPKSATGRILTVNGGSSSIKFALFELGEPPRRIHSGTVDRANTDWLDSLDLNGLLAVGHRIVHGGPKHFEPQWVTPELLADLRLAMPLDPNHLPAEIALIETIAQRLPGVPQVVCFDTAFHRDLPNVAKLLPIPRKYADAGVRRFGFHGLSYTYLLGELERQAGREIANGRVIFAHLGSGASMAAVRGGKCVDTTMGFTPAGGLMMGTRTGDIDPGVLVYLARNEAMTADQIDDLVNRKSGLLGVSGTSADMRDLLAKQATDPHAAESVELFCYQARKCIGAYAAALGGLDAIVFSGGVGERSPEVRERICDGLEFLGVKLDTAANAANAPVIANSSATVRVIPTDEEIIIARAVLYSLVAA